MSTSREYLDFIMEQLSAAEGMRARAMMGEYVLYCRDRVAGGIYDDRLMIKPTPSALEMLPGAALESPYPGAKELIVVDRLEDRDFLKALFAAMYPELPEPKPKKKK